VFDEAGEEAEIVVGASGDKIGESGCQPRKMLLNSALNLLLPSM
jgi:hypothetical protein